MHRRLKGLEENDLRPTMSFRWQSTAWTAGEESHHRRSCVRPFRNNRRAPAERARLLAHGFAWCPLIRVPADAPVGACADDADCVSAQAGRIGAERLVGDGGWRLEE
jgi:hypothetical protein